MGYRIPELRRGQRNGRLSLSFDGSAELLVASEVDQVRIWFETRTAAGLHEPAMSGAIHSYLRTHPETTFFDVGAYLGYYTLLAVAASQGRSRVCAVEMNPDSAALLERTLELNAAAASNVAVVNAAVSSRDEHRLTRIKGFSYDSQEGNERMLRFVTLDSLCERQGCTPDAIKIDVEGAEAHVLAGGARTLAARPTVFLELHRDGVLAGFGGRRETLLAGLLELGYCVYDFGDRPAAAGEVRPRQVMKADLASFGGGHPRMFVAAAGPVDRLWSSTDR